MNTTKKEKSPTRAADPVYVFIGDTLATPAGSVALGGLEKRGDMHEEDKSNAERCWQTKPNLSFATEASTATPVASEIDNGPQNWFELAADLCLQGRITETRMRRAIDAVRKGVSRE